MGGKLSVQEKGKEEEKGLHLIEFYAVAKAMAGCIHSYMHRY